MLAENPGPVGFWQDLTQGLLPLSVLTPLKWTKPTLLGLGPHPHKA